MPFTFDMADLNRYAASLSREAEADLRGALAWFGADEDEQTVFVSRHDLLQFVHYTLPRKYLVGADEHVAIAQTLAGALEHLGAPAGYAELCRSPETMALLRLWAVDEDAAFAQFAARMDASGLEPPDIEDLHWQGVMGMAEASAREAATLALERALESGDARPAAVIVRAVLAESDPEGVHASRLLAVHAERLDRWAGWRDGPRRALLGPLVADLVTAQPPEWAADDVFDWLLDEAQDGLALTERGALSRALCAEVGRRRPEWTWGKPPRSETDIANLHSLHGALRESRLVRRRGRTLLATKLARELSPAARRVHLLESLLDGDAFVAAVAELTLAALVRGMPDARARVGDAVAAAGWTSAGGPLPDYAVPSTIHSVRRVLIAIGAAEGDGWSREEITLTEPGRAVVLCALNSHALRPVPAPVAPDPPSPPDLRAERVALALPPVPGGAPAHLDPVDEDDRAELVRLAHPELAAAIDAGEDLVVTEGETINPRLHLLMHAVVADRLLQDDPPEDWLMFEALLDRGVRPHEAQHIVGQRVVEQMFAELGPPPAPTPRARPGPDRHSRDRRKAQRAARRRNRR